jgi:flagellar FliL protein
MMLNLLRTALLAAGLLAMTPTFAAGGGFQAPGYLAFEPPFVLNLVSQRARFMQIKISAYVETAEAADALQYHMPVVRNALIMLLSGKTLEEARSIETREQWRAEALAEIQRLMTELAGDPAVTEVYFTDFIIQ